MSRREAFASAGPVLFGARDVPGSDGADWLVTGVARRRGHIVLASVFGRPWRLVQTSEVDGDDNAIRPSLEEGSRPRPGPAAVTGRGQTRARATPDISFGSENATAMAFSASPRLGNGASIGGRGTLR